MNIWTELVARQIRDCLTKVADDLKSDKITADGPWTKAIMAGLRDLGKNYDLKTCASGIDNDPDWGEWLYDLCWVDAETNETTGWNLRSVPLVAECEWQHNLWAIGFDFDKLLLARADLKLMIYQDIPNHSVKKIADHLAERAKAFSGPDDEGLYVLAGYDNDEKVRAFSYWTISGQTVLRAFPEG